MIGLIQRVSTARIEVADEVIAQIGSGLAVLVGIEKGDTEGQADRLLERLLGYRIFPDSTDRMNLSLQETGKELLLVPQLTLAADTRKGMRPNFSTAAPPVESERLFTYLLTQAQKRHPRVEAGEFGAKMHVELVNEGPVTFWLQARP